jgi:hypothetical protein
MSNNKSAVDTNNHLFQVEILLEDASHALAIAALMQVLNHSKVKDFRITGGIELGKVIEAALASAQAPLASAAPLSNLPPASFDKVPSSKPAASQVPAPPAQKKQTKVYTPDDKEKLQSELFEEYRKSGTLIRLTVVKAKGVKLSMPCRVLNFDVADSQLTIYHVDEKRVYSFKLNEIEDMVAH